MNVELLRSLLVESIVPPAPKVEKPGPHQCCADFAFVVICDGDTDTWECACCNTTWEAPCQ